MVELSPIQTCDFEEIFAKYLAKDDDRLEKEDWQPLFTPLCQAIEEPLVGYKLTSGNQIVGILGTILSARKMGDQSLKFCNLHSWFVDEDQRGNSLTLMRPILRLKDFIITDFSPTPDVFKISSRLGFQTFQISQSMLRTPPALNTGFDNEGQLFWDEQIDRNSLDDELKWTDDDYRARGFHRLLVEASSGKALLIIRRNRFHWRPYADVLFVSNPSLLTETQPLWHRAILKKLEVKRIVGPSKYLSPQLKGSYRVPFPNQLLFRSSSYGPEVIDTLYSEVSHLGLTTLPGARNLIRKTLHSMNPLNWFKKSSSEGC